ncbi:MAG: hypothetical protein O3C10_09065 [Chloroflexi bacterium]|nr:hypothetical protein [Chloroflexota bacterium]
MATRVVPELTDAVTDSAKSQRENWAADPVGFVRGCLGASLWDGQVEILEAVRDHVRVAVRSCNGSGKSYAAAHVVLWWLMAFPESMVITTAPTERQVREVLWREVRRAYRGNEELIEGKLTRTTLELGDKHYAHGISTNEAERFQGFHEGNILFVVDEASGVREDIFEAIEGSMTSAGARLLLLGNPTALGGTFYEAFHRRRELWHTMHISAFDTPNVASGEIEIPGLVSPQWVSDAALNWGEDSPMYQVRVLGEFPSEGEDSLIALRLIEAAVLGVPQEAESHAAVLRGPQDAESQAAVLGDSQGVISGSSRGLSIDPDPGASSILNPSSALNTRPEPGSQAVLSGRHEPESQAALSTRPEPGSQAALSGRPEPESQAALSGRPTLRLSKGGHGDDAQNPATNSKPALREPQGGKDQGPVNGGDRKPEDGPIEIGVDVARFGSDRSVLCVRQGERVLSLDVFGRQDTMATAGRVVEAVRRYRPVAVRVDAIGIGAGVVDRLRELGVAGVSGVNVSERARNPEQFLNLRAELFDGLRQRFQEGRIQIPDDPDLIAELSSLRYSFSSSGQVKLESKDQLRSRGMPSPDRADALMLAFATDRRPGFKAWA